MEILLILMCLFFFVLFVISFRLLLKSAKLVREYEEFFSQSAEEITSVLDGLNQILTKRDLLSEDPDIKNLMKGLYIAQDSLHSYVSVYQQREREQRTETKE